MHIIGCLDVGTSGRYLLDGIDVSQLDDFALSVVRNRKIGFVFQSFNLIPRTIGVRERRAADGLRERGEGRAPASGRSPRSHAVGLGDRADALPEPALRRSAAARRASRGRS